MELWRVGEVMAERRKVPLLGVVRDGWFVEGDGRVYVTWRR